MHANAVDVQRKYESKTNQILDKNNNNNIRDVLPIEITKLFLV